MIDHMLVNLKKYYEGMFPCYIGMNIKAPKSSLPAYYIAENPVDGTDMLPSTSKPSLTPAELENKEVIAQRLNGLNDFYLLIQPAGYYSYINCWIKLSDLVKNGGVSHSLLTHVYHALTAFRKQVRSMIDHMMFNLKKYYQGDTPNYIGKAIKANANIKTYRFENWDSYDIGQKIVSETRGEPFPSGKVYGQLKDGNTIYLIFKWNGNYCLAKLDDLIQNGGDIE